MRRCKLPELRYCSTAWADRARLWRWQSQQASCCRGGVDAGCTTNTQWTSMNPCLNCFLRAGRCDGALVVHVRRTRNYLASRHANIPDGIMGQRQGSQTERLELVAVELFAIESSRVMSVGIPTIGRSGLKPVSFPKPPRTTKSFEERSDTVSHQCGVR